MNAAAPGPRTESDDRRMLQQQEGVADGTGAPRVDQIPLDVERVDVGDRPETVREQRAADPDGRAGRDRADDAGLRLCGLPIRGHGVPHRDVRGGRAPAGRHSRDSSNSCSRVFSACRNRPPSAPSTSRWSYPSVR